jgi:hypothetical protein
MVYAKVGVSVGVLVGCGRNSEKENMDEKPEDTGDGRKVGDSEGDAVEVIPDRDEKPAEKLSCALGAAVGAAVENRLEAICEEKIAEKL